MKGPNGPIATGLREEIVTTKHTKDTKAERPEFLTTDYAEDTDSSEPESKLEKIYSD